MSLLLHKLYLTPTKNQNDKSHGKMVLCNEQMLILMISLCKHHLYQGDMWKPNKKPVKWYA